MTSPKGIFSDVELPSNRRFGFFFTAILAAVGAYLLSAGPSGPAYLSLGLAAVLLLVTLLKADLLLPLNKLWMRLGLLLGMIVSPIVLGVIFFGLFMPLGLSMRLLGRDELRLKLAGRASHWKERRNTDGAPGDAFKHQF